MHLLTSMYQGPFHPSVHPSARKRVNNKFNVLCRAPPAYSQGQVPCQCVVLTKPWTGLVAAAAAVTEAAARGGIQCPAGSAVEAGVGRNRCIIPRVDAAPLGSVLHLMGNTGAWRSHAWEGRRTEGILCSGLTSGVFLFGPGGLVFHGGVAPLQSPFHPLDPTSTEIDAMTQIRGGLRSLWTGSQFIEMPHASGTLDGDGRDAVAIEQAIDNLFKDQGVTNWLDAALVAITVDGASVLLSTLCKLELVQATL